MRNRTLFAAVLAAASIGVAACGGSSSGGSGSNAGPSSAAASGKAIKVGMICSCTGPFGATGIADAGKVAQAWAKSVNDSGGVNGHPIDLTVYDDTGNPGTSVTKAQALIDAHVAVILDLTPLDAAWAKNIDSAHIPVVGGNFSSQMFFTDPLFYPAGQTNDSIVYANVAVAKQSGAHKFGQLYCAEAPQCQESVAPGKQMAAQQGIPDVYDASISATAPNYTAQCLAAKQKGVDALFIGDSAAVFARVATDCNKQGYNPAFIQEGTGFTMALAEAPGVKNHLWQSYPVTPFWATDRPEVKAMVDAVDKYYPGLTDDKSGFSEFGAQGWAGGKLIEVGVKNSGVQASGTVDAAAMIQGLDRVHNENLGGWVPSELNFSPGQVHKVDCFYVGRVQDGKPKLVSSKPTCQSS
jgi:branched-chain amino acid transport system substrate-binding protein